MQELAGSSDRDQFGSGHKFAATAEERVYGKNEFARLGRLQRIILSTRFNPAGPPDEMMTFFSKFSPSCAPRRNEYPSCVLGNK